MSTVRVLQFALDDLAGIFGDPHFAADIGPKTTCTEAATIADSLRVAGHDREADIWLAGHADGDTEFDLHYRPQPRTTVLT